MLANFQDLAYRDLALMPYDYDLGWTGELGVQGADSGLGCSD